MTWLSGLVPMPALNDTAGGRVWPSRCSRHRTTVTEVSIHWHLETRAASAKGYRCCRSPAVGALQWLQLHILPCVLLGSPRTRLVLLASVLCFDQCQPCDRLLSRRSRDRRLDSCMKQPLNARRRTQQADTVLAGLKNAAAETLRSPAHAARCGRRQTSWAPPAAPLRSRSAPRRLSSRRGRRRGWTCAKECTKACCCRTSATTSQARHPILSLPPSSTYFMVIRGAACSTAVAVEPVFSASL